MDLVSFRSLHDSCMRLRKAEDIEQSTTMAVAVNLGMAGKIDRMDKYMHDKWKAWSDEIGGDNGQSAADFLKQFPKGI